MGPALTAAEMAKITMLGAGNKTPHAPVATPHQAFSASEHAAPQLPQQQHLQQTLRLPGNR
jgi:hypothetical protein